MEDVKINTFCLKVFMNKIYKIDMQVEIYNIYVSNNKCKNNVTKGKNA